MCIHKAIIATLSIIKPLPGSACKISTSIYAYLDSSVAYWAGVDLKKQNYYSRLYSFHLLGGADIVLLQTMQLKLSKYITYLGPFIREVHTRSSNIPI